MSGGARVRSSRVLLAAGLVALLTGCARSADLPDHSGVSTAPGPSGISSAPLSVPPVSPTPSGRLTSSLPGTSSESPAQPSSPTVKDVQPIISYVGRNGSLVEVNGFVPGVIESGGQCTAVFSDGAGRVVERSGSAEADATTTICEPLTVSATELSGGTWTVLLRYRSDTSAGVSSPSPVS